VDLINAVAEKAGFEVEFNAMAFDSVISEVMTNPDTIGVSGISITDERKLNVDFSEGYINAGLIVVVKADSGFASSEDLAGKVVAVQLGTSGEALLNGDLSDLAATFDNVITCDSFLKCFTELEGNAVDAVFVDLPVAASYVAKHDGLNVIDENLGAEQYGIAFRSGDEALCEAVDAAVQELVANGTYAEIAAKEEYADIVNNLLFLSETEEAAPEAEAEAEAAT
jgi:ABC-type amino acid transport substrate-binding protein